MWTSDAFQKELHMFSIACVDDTSAKFYESDSTLFFRLVNSIARQSVRKPVITQAKALFVAL